MSQETQSTEIGEHKVKLSEFVKGSEGELIILQDIEQTKETLIALAKKYEHLQIVTKENFKEAKEARAEVREIRYGIQNIIKHNKGLLNTAKNNMEKNIGSLTEFIEPTEDRLDEGIKAIENEEKIEKARKDQEEKDRVLNINKRLKDYSLEFEKLISLGRTDEDFLKFEILFTELETAKNNDEFQEFTFEVDNILDEYAVKVEKLKSRIAQIKEDNEKEAVLKKEREEFEAKKKLEEEQKAKEDEERKAEREKLDREKAEFEERKNREEREKNEAKEREEAESRRISSEFQTKCSNRINQLIELGLTFDLDSTYTDGSFMVDILDIKTYADERWEKLITQIKNVFEAKTQEAAEKEKSEKEAEENKNRLIQFKSLYDEAIGLGVDLSEMEINLDLIPSVHDIVLIEEKVTSKKSEITEEIEADLKKKGYEHLVQISPSIEAIHNYFAKAVLLPEHEHHIVTFEDEIRESFKKLKKSIS